MFWGVSMTLPEKGSRTISVNDTKYRWMVTGNDMIIDVIIEQDNVKGQKLLSGFDYHNGANEGYTATQERIVSPEVIKKLILRALEIGWEPGVQGKPDFFVSGEVVPILK